MDYCTPSQHQVYKGQIARLEDQLRAKEKQIAMMGGDHVCTGCDVFLDPKMDCEIFKYAKMARGVKPDKFSCRFHSAWGE